MSDSESDDESIMIETGIDNGITFRSIWDRHTEGFLKREEHVTVRGTTVSEEEASDLIIKYDIDGISIRWKDIGKGMLLEYTHLSIAPRMDLDIRPIYSVVKKHLNLHQYGRHGIEQLKNSVGFQLMYYGGWDTWLAFVPKSCVRQSYSRQQQHNMTIGNLSRLRVEFQRQLKELLEKGEAIDTLAKNNLENVQKLFVLPGDRRKILSVFQHSLECIELVIDDFNAMLYTFRFGEKCKTPVKLPIFDEDGVEDICVHVGIKISDNFHDLLWCREGLNEVIGRRGILTSCLSFFECVNFQSNLDERGFDIGKELLKICRFPNGVRFLQMYADIPHRRPQTIVHPVSASVMFAEGIFRKASQNKLNKDALEYLSEIRNNFNQIRTGTCRMEFVVALPTIRFHIVASDLIFEDQILGLLKERAMVVPFSKDDNVMGCVRELGLDLCEKLLNIYKTRRGTGDSDAVWYAYQYELAVERLIWGNPLCFMSHIYSVNLGIGLGRPTRSLTDQKGFLCLEESSACCIDENTTPPLNIYTKNATVQRQIARVFGLVNYVNASSNVVGRRVMLSLLRDMYDIGNVFVRFEQFLLMLKTSSGNVNKRIVGGMTMKEVGAKLGHATKIKWPMVFGTVKILLGNDPEKVERICVEGIYALGLGYFPAFRVYDENRNEGLNWRYTYGFWVLMDDKHRVTSFEKEAASVHALVLSELEKMKICHTSQYEASVFPWLKSCLEKIAEKKLNMVQKVQVLAFLSGVGLKMNGRFVDYLNLSRLERKLPVSQVMLRMMEVQCKFRLSDVNTLQLFRLHPSVPYKLCDKKRAANCGPSAEQQRTQSQREYIRDEDELSGMESVITINDNGGDQVEIVRSRHMANGASSRTVLWNKVEMDLLMELVAERDGTAAEMYKQYREKCHKRGIPDRSLKAFRRKFCRVLQSLSISGV